MQEAKQDQLEEKMQLKAEEIKATVIRHNQQPFSRHHLGLFDPNPLSDTEDAADAPKPSRRPKARSKSKSQPKRKSQPKPASQTLEMIEKHVRTVKNQIFQILLTRNNPHRMPDSELTAKNLEQYLSAASEPEQKAALFDYVLLRHFGQGLYWVKKTNGGAPDTILVDWQFPKTGTCFPAVPTSKLCWDWADKKTRG